MSSEATNIVDKAIRLIKTYAMYWPEDEWFSLSPQWELNLWTDTNDEPPLYRATLYATENGLTNTAMWLPIDLDDIQFVIVKGHSHDQTLPPQTR